MIITLHRYTRADLRNNPQLLFVFGDNMAHVGLGGQAGEARGEPNAFGIPTMWSPGHPFCAEDVNNTQVVGVINHAFEVLTNHPWPIVWPLDGVGTGIANLPVNAPKIMETIQTLTDELFRVRGTKLPVQPKISNLLNQLRPEILAHPITTQKAFYALEEEFQYLRGDHLL